MGTDNESTSRRAYKKLVFELTGEILRDIYADENEASDGVAPPEGGPEALARTAQMLRQRHRYFKGYTPPTHPDDVTPIVSKHVLDLLNLRDSTEPRGRPARTSALKKWTSRKKRDAVDEVLLAELKEEEPEWVDYQPDELAVKNQVADAIFEDLLLETARTMATIASKKLQPVSS